MKCRREYSLFVPGCQYPVRKRKWRRAPRIRIYPKTERWAVLANRAVMSAFVNPTRVCIGRTVGAWVTEEIVRYGWTFVLSTLGFPKSIWDTNGRGRRLNSCLIRFLWACGWYGISSFLDAPTSWEIICDDAKSLEYVEDRPLLGLFWIWSIRPKRNRGDEKKRNERRRRTLLTVRSTRSRLRQKRLCWCSKWLCYELPSHHLDAAIIHSSTTRD